MTQNSNRTLLSQLQPKRVWELFAELTQIPRLSNQEEGVRIWLREFCNQNNLNFKQDSIGNLVIYKDAQYQETTKTLLLQAHMDMVCQKTEDLEFNFETDPIQVRVENGNVYATNTTLGADNGIGLCMILAILEDKNLPHPKIQALFTMNEETGMTGVSNLDKNLISGDYMINLDAEEEGIIWTSSAGGRDLEINIDFQTEALPASGKSFELVISNLRGGHSGVNIHENRLNGIKLLASILDEFQQFFELQLTTYTGGSAVNAIPSFSKSAFYINNNNSKALTIFQNIIDKYLKQYTKAEPNLTITLKSIESFKDGLSVGDTRKILLLVNSIHSGVYQMSTELIGLVQTSFNLGIINLQNDGQNSTLFISGMARSNDNFELSLLCQNLISNVGLVLVKRIELDSFNSKEQIYQDKNIRFTLNKLIPGWKHDPNNPLLDLFKKSFEKLNSKPALIQAVHAGLECGMIKQYLPDCKIVSFGPTIENAHSPMESVNIKSVEACYKVVLEVIKNLK